MKTKEELNTLKKEVEAVNKKLRELNAEELAEVTGGGSFDLDIEERVARGRGDYGNGSERKYALRTDGYDYGRVQNEINRRLVDEKKRQGWLEEE